MAENTNKIFKKSSLKFDLKIYDPNEADSRKGTQVKLKGKDLDSPSIREIMKKYFG